MINTLHYENAVGKIGMSFFIYCIFFKYCNEVSKMKFIPGFKNLYSVTEDGRVFSHIRNRFRKLFDDKKGYLTIRLQTENGTKSYRVHRLVALTYIPNPGNKETVNHKDANKLNNCVSNLEWMSHQENMAHAYSNNLIGHTKGKDHHFYGITPSYCKPVYCRQTGEKFESSSHAARNFRLDPSCVNKVLRGEKNHCRGYSFSFQKTKKESFVEIAETRKKVICKNNGKVFDGIKEAAKELHLDFSAVSKICRGLRSHTKGYSFEYYTEDIQCLIT